MRAGDRGAKMYGPEGAEPREARAREGGSGEWVGRGGSGHERAG